MSKANLKTLNRLWHSFGEPWRAKKYRSSPSCHPSLCSSHGQAHVFCWWVGGCILLVLCLRCCAWAFSSFGRGSTPSLQCTGVSLHGLILLQSTGSRAGAQDLWHRGLVALSHVRFSQNRDQTHASCIGKQICNPWTTREVLKSASLRSIPVLRGSGFSQRAYNLPHGTPSSEGIGPFPAIIWEILLQPLNLQF